MNKHIKGSLVSSGNKLSGSSGSRSQEPHKIGYPDGWRKGPTEMWYESQALKKFTYLQYRKERDGPFHHEFVVVELDNNTFCRFDRRDANTRAHAFTAEGITAEDTAHVVVRGDGPFNQIDETSDMLLRMHFPEGQDLLTILGICYGIQKDESANAYTHFRYNCYFLTWTIVTATARRTVGWAILSKEDAYWEQLVQSTMAGLTPTPSASKRLTNTALAMVGIKRKGNPPSVSTQPAPFVGSAYLIDVLRQALIDTRVDIGLSLTGLIFRTSVREEMIAISKKSAMKAAIEAARMHAAHAAEDAVMEAVVESMWQTILASDKGPQNWDEHFQGTRKCTQTAAKAAAEAAADAATQAQADILPSSPSDPSTVQPAAPPAAPSAQPPTRTPPIPVAHSAAATAVLLTPTPDRGGTLVGKEHWEEAWNAAWNESCDTVFSVGKNPISNINNSDSRISRYTKAAWLKAWTDACEANDTYVPLLSTGVADFVMKNLPEIRPELLKFDATTQAAMKTTKTMKMTKVMKTTKTIKAMGEVFAPSENSNAKLQEWIQDRIVEHCKHVASYTNKMEGVRASNQDEIEVVMRRVWSAITKLEYESMHDSSAT